MSKRDNRCDIKCPYYITDGDKYITCEGIYTDVLKQRFKNAREIDMFQRKLCFKYPNECSIANENDKKYK